jgi:integrase/recombinase XerD
VRKDAGSERTGKSPQPHARNEIHEQGRELGCAKWIQLRNPATKQQSSFVGGGGCARIACATTPVNGYSRRFRALGLTLPHYGAHMLRHACASQLLSQGLSLKEIGDHLGHSDPDVTRIYAKVDLAALRAVGDVPLEGLP